MPSYVVQHTTHGRPINHPVTWPVSVLRAVAVPGGPAPGGAVTSQHLLALVLAVAEGAVPCCVLGPAAGDLGGAVALLGEVRVRCDSVT